MENELNLDNYEVVRQDFFVTCEEPQLTFNQGRMYVNSFCVKKFEEVDYIQILVEKIEKKIVLKLLNEKRKDSFRWSTQGKKRQARHMRCIPLFYTLFNRMKWDINARYRITGHIEETNGEQVLVFLLKDAQCFVPVATDEKNGHKIYRHEMPEDWKMTFGMTKRDYAEGEFVLRFEEDGVYEIELPVSREHIKTINNIKNGISDSENKVVE